MADICRLNENVYFQRILEKAKSSSTGWHIIDNEVGSPDFPCFFHFNISFHFAIFLEVHLLS